jgi:hypothetical protein
MTNKKISLSVSSSSDKRIEEILAKCRFYRDDINLMVEEAIDNLYKSLLSKGFKR